MDLRELTFNTVDTKEKQLNTPAENTLKKTSSIFPLNFIVTDINRKEIGYIDDYNLDIDIGDTNDFVLTLKTEEWDINKFNLGNYIVCNKTEYGGQIQSLQVVTSTDEIILSGYTFRGLLTQKIVEPPKDTSHLILNGELNTLIREIIGERFGSLFDVSKIDTGVTVSNYQVDRYITVLDCLTKLLSSVNYRLQIEYISGDPNGSGYVLIKAVPVIDYSEQLEYSQDSNINFDITDNKQGINHLICGGQGENELREIIHLYVQEDGTISEDNQYYFGLDERVAFYDYSSAQDIEELRLSGIEKLKELQNYKQISMSVSDIDLEIGDIVGGRERITNTTLKKPVIQKILTVKEGQLDIQYKVKGDD